MRCSASCEGYAVIASTWQCAVAGSVLIRWQTSKPSRPGHVYVQHNGVGPERSDGGAGLEPAVCLVDLPVRMCPGDGLGEHLGHLTLVVNDEDMRGPGLKFRRNRHLRMPQERQQVLPQDPPVPTGRAERLEQALVDPVDHRAGVDVEHFGNCKC